MKVSKPTFGSMAVQQRRLLLVIAAAVLLPAVAWWLAGSRSVPALPQGLSGDIAAAPPQRLAATQVNGSAEPETRAALSALQLALWSVRELLQGNETALESFSNAVRQLSLNELKTLMSELDQPETQKWRAHYDIMQGLYAHWAHQDAAGAMQSAVAFSHEELRAPAVMTVLRETPADQRKLAWAAHAVKLPAEEQTELFAMLLKERDLSQRKDWITWVETLPREPGVRALSVLNEVWLSEGVDSAPQLISSQMQAEAAAGTDSPTDLSPAVQTFVTQWARKAPEAAAQWMVQELAQHPQAPAFIAQLMTEWSEKDATAAGEFVNQLELPEGRQRDALLAGYARSVSRYDQAAALEWVATISSSELRAQTHAACMALPSHATVERQGSEP
jgi:hypothetical protein